MLPEESEVLGGICLNVFLSCALMSLKLWQLADLAIPLIATLIVQVSIMGLFAYFVIFRVMGRNCKQPSWHPATAASALVPHRTPSQI